MKLFISTFVFLTAFSTLAAPIIKEGGLYRTSAGQFIFITSIYLTAERETKVVDQNGHIRGSYELDTAEELRVSQMDGPVELLFRPHQLESNKIVVERVAFLATGRDSTKPIVVGYRNSTGVILLTGESFPSEFFPYPALTQLIKTTPKEKMIELGWSVFFPLVKAMLQGKNEENAEATVRDILRELHARPSQPRSLETWESSIIGLLTGVPTNKHAGLKKQIETYVNGIGCGRKAAREIEGTVSLSDAPY